MDDYREDMSVNLLQYHVKICDKIFAWLDKPENKVRLLNCFTI